MTTSISSAGPSARPSITLVTYAEEPSPLLEASVRSALMQNYPVLRLVVVDAGGASNFASLRRYRSRLAHWISAVGVKPAAALHTGFARTDSEILGWLCAGDLLLPGALHTVSDFFTSRKDAAALYGDALSIDAGGQCLSSRKEIPFNRFVLRYDHNYIPRSSMFWRRSLYDAVGGLDRALSSGLDTDLWCRISRNGRIHHLPRYLSGVRSSPARNKCTVAAGNVAVRNAPQRRTIFARTLHPVFVPCAKALRIVLKACCGAYHTRPPRHLVNWLRTITRRAVDDRDEFARTIVV